MYRTHRHGALPQRFILLLSAFLVACSGGDAGGMVLSDTSVLDVPPGSVAQVRFQFYAGADGSGELVQTELVDFSSSLTVHPDAASQSVVITALSAEGYPRAEVVVPLSPRTHTLDLTAGDVRRLVPEVLSLEPDETTISVDATLPYEAAVLFSNGDTVVALATDVSWTATGQATIDTEGVATGTDDGAATITASFEGVEGTAALTIGAGLRLARVEVSPEGASVGLGADIPFTVAGFDQHGGAFTLDGLVVAWSATGDAVIDVATGIATGTQLASGTLAGAATITATVGLLSDSTALAVVGVPGDIVSIETSPSPLTLTLDAPNGALTTLGVFENGPNVPLTNADHGLLYAVTGNPGCASVDMLTGEVTAIAQGTTEVSASALGRTHVVVVEVGFGVAGNAPPVVTLDANFAGDYSASILAFPNATVADPTQAAFVGGVLTVTDLDGSATLTVPTTPDIGMITGNGSDAVSIALSALATPASVQDVLRNTTISGGPLSAVEVSLSDGLGMGDSALRRFAPADLVLSDGATHSFDTDTGLLDAESVPRPGWNGSTLALSAFTLASGTTLTVTGSQPFSVTADDITLGGTLLARGAAGGPGAGAVSPATGQDGEDGGDGGSVILASTGDLMFSGTLDLRGGQGGNGGASSGTGAGTMVAGSGGDGGDGGTATLTAGGTLTNVGTVMQGAGHGGHGGSIMATGTLLAGRNAIAGHGGAGGSGAPAGNGGNGGAVSVGSTVQTPNTVRSGDGGAGGAGRAGVATGGHGGSGGNISVNAINTPNSVEAGNGGAGGGMASHGGDGGNGGSVSVTANSNAPASAGDGGPGGNGTVSGGAGGNGGNVTVGSGQAGSGGAGGAGGTPGGTTGSAGTP